MGKEPKAKTIGLKVSNEDKEMWRKFAHEQGFNTLSSFFLFCARKYQREQLNKTSL